MPQGDEPSFAEMAVSLGIAADKLGFDVARLVARAVDFRLSDDAINIAVGELQSDAVNVSAAHQLLKQLADIEPQVRALLARRSTGKWPMLKVVS